ncbi:unnamed protein product [Trichobilharzia regenti]|nr:unnamed protein product [Trichobilharzia regenti]
MLASQAKGPESHAREYDKYQFLVNRQVSNIFITLILCNCNC